MLPPWLNVAVLLLEDTREPAERRHLADTARPDADRQSTSLLHFAVRGAPEASAAAFVPIDMQLHKAHDEEEAAELEDEEGSGGELGETCPAEQWWAYGSPVAIYNLADVRCCSPLLS